jgi:hypothetical protein
MAWQGKLMQDMAQHRMERKGMAWKYKAWYIKAWHCMERKGKAQNGTSR